MKKNVTVTITKNIEVEIDDSLLTEEHMKEFSSFMFLVDEPDELIKFAAEQIAQFESHFIEGLGYAAWSGTCIEGEEGKAATIKYKTIFDGMDSEIEQERP